MNMLGMHLNRQKSFIMSKKIACPAEKKYIRVKIWFVLQKKQS